MASVVIWAAYRSPIGTLNGSLKQIPAHQLSASLIIHALSELGICEGQFDQHIDQVIIGQVLNAGCGMNPARQASVASGLPSSIPAVTINQVCGSGMRAVAMAVSELLASCSTSSHVSIGKCIIAGGQENMSSAPLLLPNSFRHKGFHLNHQTMLDSLIHDGLWDPTIGCHVGTTAENVAQRFHVTREEQDLFASESQRKYRRARELNWFESELVCASFPASNSSSNNNNMPIVKLSEDEHPRSAEQTTPTALGRLKPCFAATLEGSVTAGNTCGINDGAAILILALEGYRPPQANMQPLARIVCWNQVGCDPQLMGVAPVDACRNCLSESGLTIEQIDLFELNEAFAAQTIAVIRQLNIPMEKVNVCGGAIALGHPIGASGARCLVTLAHSLRRMRLRFGMAALCIGGGMGIAMVIENMNYSG